MHGTYIICLGQWPELLRYFDYTADLVVDIQVIKLNKQSYQK